MKRAIVTWGLLLYLSSGLGVTWAAAEEEQPCPKPYVDTLLPRAGKPGEEIKIRGNRFGKEQGSVIFSPGIKAQVVKWTYKRIWVTVPEHSQSGPAYVSIPCGEMSNEVHFTVEEK